MLRAGLCGTGAMPSARHRAAAAMVSRVSVPGSMVTLTRVLAGSEALKLSTRAAAGGVTSIEGPLARA